MAARDTGGGSRSEFNLPVGGTLCPRTGSRPQVSVSCRTVGKSRSEIGPQVSRVSLRTAAAHSELEIVFLFIYNEEKSLCL